MEEGEETVTAGYTTQGMEWAGNHPGFSPPPVSDLPQRPRWLNQREVGQHRNLGRWSADVNLPMIQSRTGEGREWS